ncbi:hypothetical protein [Amnibacterium endophyticum]|uniref:Di-and tripeptidase n=1 Tax=Amnibacterium endophyticum TaxID=2109337 RepID=A0ABW4L9M9_9MICO
MAKDADDELEQTWTKRGWDRLLVVQRPAVLAHLRGIRKRHPEASPEQVLRILEKRYLAAVTAGGAASGAAAVVPGVGTIASVGISGVETVGFLEASALFAQSVAEVHGVAVTEPERASTMVMALMLGPSGSKLVEQFTGEMNGTGGPRSEYWGQVVGDRMPVKFLKPLADRVRRTFLKRFAARQGGSVVLRAVPFGVGAVIGGAGNRMAGGRVVKATREAFGAAPSVFPGEVLIGEADADERALDGGHVD